MLFAKQIVDKNTIEEVIMNMEARYSIDIMNGMLTGFIHTRRVMVNFTFFITYDIQ